MRVIRYGSGWDIALDMVFTDQATAGTIAARLLPAIHALLREAVDASMSPSNAAKKAPDEIFPQPIPLENQGRTPASDTDTPWSGRAVHSTPGGPHSKSAQAKVALQR